MCQVNNDLLVLPPSDIVFCDPLATRSVYMCECARVWVFVVQRKSNGHSIRARVPFSIRVARDMIIVHRCPLESNREYIGSGCWRCRYLQRKDNSILNYYATSFCCETQTFNRSIKLINSHVPDEFIIVCEGPGEDLVPSMATSMKWNSPTDEFFTLMWPPRRGKRTTIFFFHLPFIAFESSTLALRTALWARWWRSRFEENWNQKM